MINPPKTLKAKESSWFKTQNIINDLLSDHRFINYPESLKNLMKTNASIEADDNHSTLVEKIFKSFCETIKNNRKLLTSKMKVNPAVNEEKDMIIKNKENWYVSPKMFKEQIRTYYETDLMNDELAINLVKIAEGLSYKYNFIGYTKSWKDEMIGDAIVKMYSALESKKFRIDSEFSPFAYFNQIAWHAFCNRIKKEKKQHDGLEEYKQLTYEQSMHETSGGSVYVKPHLESDENDGDYE